jgi:tetratricopeptide (TPR) repeat protein
MIADRLDLVDEMERDLRTVITIKPDHAHAYNALGYSFAERGIRLDEALTLIQKAVALAPEDAYILDSLGWVQFRLKRSDEALATLTRAYSMRSDPEIAAHLGEVLWAKGNRLDAQQLWKRALIENPENAALLSMIERFKE